MLNDNQQHGLKNAKVDYYYYHCYLDGSKDPYYFHKI